MAKTKKVQKQKTSVKLAKKPQTKSLKTAPQKKASTKVVYLPSGKKASKVVKRSFGSFKKFAPIQMNRRSSLLNVKIVKRPKNKDLILVLDFGSSHTQLIARSIRENKVYSRIVPFHTSIEEIREMSPKGLILSGGQMSVYDKKAPLVSKEIFDLGIPVLGIGYGAQVITHLFGGSLTKSKDRDFAKAELFVDSNKDLFANLPTNLTGWMSQSDSILQMPKGFEKLAHTLNHEFSAIAHRGKKIFALQFHPEIVHTQRGAQILQNFATSICGCLPRWTMDRFVASSVKNIQETVGKKKVILGLSGGVDSSVTAMLLHQAVKKQLHCIFVDTGLLRKGEAQAVYKNYKVNFKMNVTMIDASKEFLAALKGVVDPEEKRKIIGRVFVEVFQAAAKKIKGVEFLAQGTLYPDVIESVMSPDGTTVSVKSHHNVGGLPKSLHLQLLEPLRELFKDEVRAMGKVMNMPEPLLKRQPFPGPGLGVRVVGDITQERLQILREADERVVDEIRKANLYNQVWQSFAVLLPIKTVGVKNTQRTYENVIAIRCVSSVDGMSADWVELPYDLLRRISSRIMQEVQGVNRVVYDISTKPPATIEWE